VILTQNFPSLKALRHVDRFVNRDAHSDLFFAVKKIIFYEFNRPRPSSVTVFVERTKDLLVQLHQGEIINPQPVHIKDICALACVLDNRFFKELVHNFLEQKSWLEAVRPGTKTTN
jgi:hypothetical protein